MKHFILLTCVVGTCLAVIDLDVNTENKKHNLVLLAKVRNYLTDDNKVNDVYIREVNRVCWNLPEKFTNKEINLCGVEKDTPEETVLHLYECIAEIVRESQIEDNAQRYSEIGLCQLKLINFIKDGKINKVVVKQKLIAEGEKESKAEKVVEKCSIDKATPEATADNFIECLAREYGLTK